MLSMDLNITRVPAVNPETELARLNKLLADIKSAYRDGRRGDLARLIEYEQLEPLKSSTAVIARYAL